MTDTERAALLAEIERRIWTASDEKLRVIEAVLDL